MDDWEEEHASNLIRKEELKRKWDDEDVDDNGVKESWEDEDEDSAPASPAEKVPDKSTAENGKGGVEVEKEPSLDSMAEKLSQLRLLEEKEKADHKSIAKGGDDEKESLIVSSQI